MLQKLTTWYKNLPDKKKNLDFFIALLTIPVLLTVITSNIISLRNKAKENENKEKEENQKPTTIIITQNPQENTNGGITIIPIEATKKAESPTEKPECLKDIGPIEISYPKENQVVTEEPLCIQIDYKQGNYCSVVWSYRLNEGKWSDYTDKSACFNNLPNGETKFELHVKSLASDKNITLERNFILEKTTTPTQTLSPSPSPSISPT